MLGWLLIIVFDPVTDNCAGNGTSRCRCCSTATTTHLIA
ncbi:hypothetical protein IMCC9480_891 [Oxalobacteraceae bacterium IMCC9480]|nr:hypothetical protein IMCC9480_891 [Oxalobacteraceae bacterium IMCC9480]